MAAIGFLLFFLVPCIFLYSLFKPEKFNISTKKNRYGKWTRLQSFVAFVGAWLVAVIILVQGVQDSEPQTSAEKSSDMLSPEENEAAVTAPIAKKPITESKPTVEKTEAKKSVEKQDKTFGITVPEYEKRILALAKDLGIGDFKGEPIKITKGEVNDTFTIKSNDSFGVVGIVDKNGELKGLTNILGKTEPGDNQGTSFLLMAGMDARVLVPDVPKEQVGEALFELMQKSIEEAKETGSSKNSKVVGAVNFTVSISKYTGIQIIFTPAE